MIYTPRALLCMLILFSININTLWETQKAWIEKYSICCCGSDLFLIQPSWMWMNFYLRCSYQLKNKIIVGHNPYFESNACKRRAKRTSNYVYIITLWNGSHYLAFPQFRCAKSTTASANGIPPHTLNRQQLCVALTQLDSIRRARVRARNRNTQN